MRVGKIVLALCLVPMLAQAMDRMAALSIIESGNNDRAVGKAGEISRYQIKKSEWRKITRSRAYTNPKVAKAVALKILAKRVAQFRAVYHREPNDFEFYALWNAPGQVLKGRISPVVAERCRRFANLCQWNLAQTAPPKRARRRS